MIKEIKAFILLAVIAFVWGYFVFYTLFGWFQLVFVVLCLVLRVFEKPLFFLVKCFKWQSTFKQKYIWLKHQCGNWCFTLWISNDQYMNSLFKGNEDHTISGRVGYLSVQGCQTAKVMEKVINLLFFIVVGQRDHCYASIEYDEVEA